jgi:hypothetical protein
LNFLIFFTIINIVQPSGLNLGVGTAGEASLGYRKGPFLPYLSLSFMSVSGTYTYLFKSYNDNLPEPYKERIDGDTIKVNIGLLTNRLGTKIFFQGKQVKPFINISAALPFPLYVSIKDDDESEQQEWDSLKARIYEKPEPTITLSAGFGLEKFIGERFSIAGELNYNYTFGGMWLQDRYFENQDMTYWEKEERQVDYKIGRTSTAIWLNYYF